MTPLARVFMLDASARLSAAVMLQVYKNGFTRIPVCQGGRAHLRGQIRGRF